MQTLELCATQQAGKTCTDPACAAFHAQAPAVVAAEAAQKRTVAICAYFLRGKCEKGAACPALHALRAPRTLVRVAAPPPGLLPAVAPGRPARSKAEKSAPFALQQNSQTRGKIRQLLASEQRLTQLATSLGGCYAAEARRAAQYLTSVEARLGELNEYIQSLLNALAKEGTEGSSGSD